jgi:chromosome segregation ATPase
MARKVSTNKKYPERAADVPVTQKMLYLVRDELTHGLRGVDRRLTSVGKGFEGKIGSLETRIDVLEVKLEGKIGALETRIDALEVKLEGKIGSLETRIDALEVKLEGKIGALETRIDALDAKIDSKFEIFMSEIHKIKILVEEQNAKNNIVLDGLTSLFARQERLEDRVSKLTPAP